MSECKLTDYLPDYFREALSRELSKALSWTKPTENPSAILLAGQPGAGKTQLSAYFSRQQSSSILINGDDYRRYHPNYHLIFEQCPNELVQMTAPFSSEFTERMIEELSKARRDLIIEGTGRTTEVPLATARLLVGRGYRVRMAVIATKPELSLLSTLHRFCSMSEMGTVPRSTAMEAHNVVVENLPKNLDILYRSNLFDEMQIINRQEQIVWHSTNAQNMPSEILNNLWSAKWTDEEKADAESELSYLLGRTKYLTEEQIEVVKVIQEELADEAKE